MTGLAYVTLGVYAAGAVAVITAFILYAIRDGGYSLIGVKTWTYFVLVALLLAGLWPVFFAYAMWVLFTERN